MAGSVIEEDRRRKKDAKEDLKDVINLLEDVQENETVQVKGHTDNEGEKEYNQKLLEERAEAVEKYIRDDGDVEHLKFDVKVYGETKPAASNENEDGKKKNHRVEIIFNDES